MYHNCWCTYYVMEWCVHVALKCCHLAKHKNIDWVAILFAFLTYIFSGTCPQFSLTSPPMGTYSCPGSNITYTCVLRLKRSSWCDYSLEWISLPMSSYKPDITHPEIRWDSSTIHPRIMWQSLCCDNQCYLNMLHICPHHSCCSGSEWSHCCLWGW